ncbi:unnamed protein product [Onchocerca ochengi]|uniref:Intraflagellar transport protein 57 homolog n=1 Tax=Onchocerca ochengi TaxID=42157 RepID=A0A182EPH8_ONCOC|nr:unnamed protein product [Onchocerca ochengi]
MNFAAVVYPEDFEIRFECLDLSVRILLQISEFNEELFFIKESSPEMSARIRYQLEDIPRYLDGLREQKKTSENAINHLKKERELVALQIDELRLKHNTLDAKIGKEEEICSRLERTIAHANETYEKLVESSQSLVDYVKKEYEDARSSGSSLT